MRDENRQKKFATPLSIKGSSMYSKPIQNPADKPINEFVPFGQEQLEQSLTERFEKVVRQYPHRIAVKMGEKSLLPMLSSMP
jgi:hypothetical protein